MTCACLLLAGCLRARRATHCVAHMHNTHTLRAVGPCTHPRTAHACDTPCCPNGIAIDKNARIASTFWSHHHPANASHKRVPARHAARESAAPTITCALTPAKRIIRRHCGCQTHGARIAGTVIDADEHEAQRGAPERLSVSHGSDAGVAQRTQRTRLKHASSAIPGPACHIWQLRCCSLCVCLLMPPRVASIRDRGDQLSSDFPEGPPGPYPFPSFGVWALWEQRPDLLPEGASLTTPDE